MQMVFPQGLLGPMVSPENLWILELSVGQVPCSQVLRQTLVEEEEVEKEEKEKLHLGLVEKVLQRVVGVVEMHSLRRSLHLPQVEEEAAEAGLLPAWTRVVMESPPPSLSEHAGHQDQEVEAATTLTHPQL